MFFFAIFRELFLYQPFYFVSSHHFFLSISLFSSRVSYSFPNRKNRLNGTFAFQKGYNEQTPILRADMMLGNRGEVTRYMDEDGEVVRKRLWLRNHI